MAGPAAQHLGIAREQYAAALAARDLRGARRIALGAADDGASLASVFTEVVRPALHSVGSDWGEEGASSVQRLAFGSVRATLAVLAARPLPGRGGCGAGRDALVSVGRRPLDALDGEVIADVLTGDGWSVDEIEAGAPAADIAAQAQQRRVELVVMPTSSAADLLLSAQTYTLLRRLPDPPIIVACSLGSAAECRRARAVGADEFVDHPDRLISFVAGRLPTRGSRNWGVRFQRRGRDLVIAPTGTLDEGSVTRLRAVVDSRAGSFDGLIVDARDVATATSGGAHALLDWLETGPAQRLVAGDRLGATLAADGRAARAALLLRDAEIETL